MRNISGKICGENQDTNFVFLNFFRQLCRLRDNVKNLVQADRPQMVI